jgi:hypothetical protein
MMFEVCNLRDVDTLAHNNCDKGSLTFYLYCQSSFSRAFVRVITEQLSLDICTVALLNVEMNSTAQSEIECKLLKESLWEPRRTG